MKKYKLSFMWIGFILLMLFFVYQLAYFLLIMLALEFALWRVAAVGTVFYLCWLR